MLDLNNVGLFVHVVRAGSFSAAARRLGMPANTVSRRILDLEQQFGVRLLQRSTRKLTLTDAGSNLYARCADQIQALLDAAQEVGEGSRQPSGKMRVAAPADFFRWFPVAWMADFLAAHPKVRLEFVLSDARADLIAEGIDVALRAGAGLEPALVARRIASGRDVMVASPEYLATRGMPGSIDALPAHDCIGLLKEGGPAPWRLYGPDGMLELTPTGRFHANSMQALLDAALAGLGICLLPSLMTAPHIAEGELVEVSIPGYGTAEAGLFLVYLSRRQQPRAAYVFNEFMAAKLIELTLSTSSP